MYQFPASEVPISGHDRSYRQAELTILGITVAKLIKSRGYLYGELFLHGGTAIAHWQEEEVDTQSLPIRRVA